MASPKSISLPGATISDISTCAAALLFGPLFGTDLGAVGVSPDAFPAVFRGRVERQACVVARPVGDCDKFLIADSSADVACSSNEPNDSIGIARPLDGYSAAVTAAVAGVRAFQVILPHRIGEHGGAAQHNSGCNGDENFMHDDPLAMISWRLRLSAILRPRARPVR